MFMTPQACLEAGTEYPRYKLFVGFDVGKRFHAAHARTGSGRRVLALRVDNDEAAVDAFVARALEAAGCEPGACLVVVDQRRNIGTVVVRRAMSHVGTIAELAFPLAVAAVLSAKRRTCTGRASHRLRNLTARGPFSPKNVVFLNL